MDLPTKDQLPGCQSSLRRHTLDRSVPFPKKEDVSRSTTKEPINTLRISRDLRLACFSVRGCLEEYLTLIPDEGIRPNEDQNYGIIRQERKLAERT